MATSTKSRIGRLRQLRERLHELHNGVDPSSDAEWCDYYRALAEVEDATAALFAEARKRGNSNTFEWWAYYDAELRHQGKAAEVRARLAEREKDQALVVRVGGGR